MAIHLKCPSCKSSLKLGEKLAGEKVQCPRCQKLVKVPDVEDDFELVDCTVEEEQVREEPRRRTGRTGRIQREAPAPRREEGIRRDRRRDEDEEEIRRNRRRDEEEEELPRRKGKKSKSSEPSEYQPCPECGAEESVRVKWTAWGSFYGPALFTHVQCPECGTCYNGKTGRSNLIAAIIFVTMPLLGILGIIAGILYVVARRGHLG